MGSVKKLKDAFEVTAKYKPFFKGGNVQWTKDGEKLLCQCGGHINILDVSQGCVTTTLGGAEKEEEEEEDDICTFVLSDDDKCVISSHRSGLLKNWDLNDGSVTKTWKSVHKGPISSLALNSSGELLASGGSDSGIRLWDLPHHTCTLSLRGAQGVISVVRFHPDESLALVFGAGDDAVIRGWSTRTGVQEISLANHFSKVTAIEFHHDGKHIVSCGRDKVIVLWHLKTMSVVKTIPAYEGLEGLIVLPEKFSIPGLKVEGGVHVATAGERGIVRVWDLENGREEFVQTNSLVSPASNEGSLSIVNLLFCASTKSLAVVTLDHNIILHKLKTFKCERQFPGYSDEILDVAFVGANNSHLAVATNSVDVKLYCLSDMNCQLLKGHTDLVLGLASSPVNPSLLLSCGKDNSVHLWMLDSENQMTCVGSGSRHTASVGAIAFSQLSAKFFLSAGQDNCLKLWKLPSTLTTGDSHNLMVTHTEVAHQKEINCVCVSPNDKLVATASQDKTVKLWSVKDLSHLGTLQGHRRGVWCVTFSPVDQVLASSSADCTIKLWGIADLCCIKTFEGHESSVLKLSFLNNGMQLVSAGADGLLKLWSIKNGECVCTLDGHSGRVWALAVSSDENRLVSGCSDSCLLIWRDVTEEKRHLAEEERSKQVLMEQKLMNLLHADQLLDALCLALTLNRPLQVLKIIKGVIKKGEQGFEETLKQLRPDQKESLLNCATTWNCNSKNCHAAQLVISVLVDEIVSGNLRPQGLPKLVEGLIPYTDRHFRRLTQVLQDVHLLEYTIASMQPYAEKC